MIFRLFPTACSSARPEDVHHCQGGISVGPGVLFAWLHTWSGTKLGYDSCFVRNEILWCALNRTTMFGVFFLFFFPSFGPPNVKIWTLVTATFYENSIIMVIASPLQPSITTIGGGTTGGGGGHGPPRFQNNMLSPSPPQIS